MGWLGHDEVGLQRVAVEGLGIRLSLGVGEGRKRNRRAGSTWSIVDVGQRKRIACLVLPGLKVHGLAWADAQQDPQNFQVGHLLGERRIEAGAALLDKRKVEPRREGDRLEMGGDACGVVTADGTAGGVGVGSWDGRMLPHVQTGDGLNELRTGIEIGVGDAAVPGPEAGVHGELASGW